MTPRQYTVRPAETSDQDKWDIYVAAHPDASPYHLFAWKNAVEEAYGHKGYYLLALDNAGTITGILPLIHLRLSFLVSELTALPFCDVGSVLCDNERVSDLLLAEALTLGNKLKCQKIRLRGNTYITSTLTDKIYPEKNDKVRMFLSLPESSEALLQGFKSKLRAQIRKAEKNRLSFFWGSESDIDDYYAVFSENMRDLGSPVHSKQWFQSILKHYGTHARLGLTAFKERIVGGCIILSVGQKTSIPWASTIRRYNRLGPNMLLYWNVLKYSTDAGITTFDFGRSSEGEGTYNFKKQWGADPSPLNWYSNTRPNGSTVGTKSHAGSDGREILSEIWRKFPTPLANILGPRIRKYISL
jgi:FemAB-related protein (PEP-CTERM system-associated)